MKTPLQILEDARKILEPGDGSCNWTQRTLQGRKVLDYDATTCYCLVGAVSKAALVTTTAYGVIYNDRVLTNAFKAAIPPSYDGVYAKDIEEDIVHWNDRTERKPSEVIAALDVAIAYVKENN